MKKWRCTICGYVHEGAEPPEKCPVCGADKSLFEEIIPETQTAASASTEEKPAVEPPAADPRAGGNGAGRTGCSRSGETGRGAK